MRRTIGVAAVLAACGGVIVACAVDQGPVAPQAGVQFSRHSGGTATPVSFFVCNGNEGVSGSAVIGPLGGRLIFGPNMLSVPPGALLANTTISARMAMGDTIAVQLQPESLSFVVPATLQLSYATCNPQPTVPLQIIQVDDQLTQQIGSVSSSSQPETLVGYISRLGEYAVALK